MTHCGKCYWERDWDAMGPQDSLPEFGVPAVYAVCVCVYYVWWDV